MRGALAITTLLTLPAFAQSDKLVHATLDRDTILIGEQVTLTIEVASDNLPVTWPVIGDSLNAHIEVVHDSGLDTLQGDDGPVGARIVRTLTLTSFDTGYWAIAPLRFSIGNAQLETEPFLLHVKGLQLDSAAKARDIAPIYELPFSMLWWAKQHRVWIASALALAALIAVVILLLKRRKKGQPALQAEVLAVPLHERILAQIDALDRERVWQQGDHKGYQSRLTDLLRSYIEERYKVPALESTTDELLHELRVSPLTMEQQSLLTNMLRLADMVKFAKALPSPQENEQMLHSAIRFVRETTPKPVNDAT